MVGVVSTFTDGWWLGERVVGRFESNAKLISRSNYIVVEVSVELGNNLCTFQMNADLWKGSWFNS